MEVWRSDGRWIWVRVWISGSHGEGGTGNMEVVVMVEE